MHFAVSTNAVDVWVCFPLFCLTIKCMNRVCFYVDHCLRVVTYTDDPRTRPFMFLLVQESIKIHPSQEDVQACLYNGAEFYLKCKCELMSIWNGRVRRGRSFIMEM